MDNAAFDRESALHVRLRGELTDIMRVRGYLDAECACCVSLIRLEGAVIDGPHALISLCRCFMAKSLGDWKDAPCRP